MLSEAATEFFHCIFQAFSALKTSVVNKHGNLIWLIIRNKVNSTDGNGTDLTIPFISLSEKPKSCGSDF